MKFRSKSENRRDSDFARPEFPSNDSAVSISSKILRAQDEERRRISRELHDTIGQSLTAVKMNLAALARCAGAENKTRIEECMSILEQSITEVRTVSYLLHPPMLDLAGLSSAIEWYAEGFSERSGIEVVTDVQSLPRLSRSVETALFRVVQECLTNVHRYSGATQVKIMVRLVGNELSLEVTDNGHGIPKNRLRRATDRTRGIGVGIPGMRERLRELGGNLEIRSGQWGTRVSALLPHITGRFLAQAATPPHPGAAQVIEVRDNRHERRRILIVDDHEVIRRGVRDLFKDETEIEICGEASNARAAIEMIQNLSPDLVILDLQMPGDSGWKVVSELRKRGLPMKVLIFTAFAYEGLVRTVRLAGCQGVVIKSKASSDLIVAAREVLGGGVFFDETAAAAHG